VILDEVLSAPGAFRFQGLYVVSANGQLYQNAAEEMSITVVPIRNN
jgi:hypothetical protein